MPKETDRLKLPLPLGNENVTRESINGIFEKIDAGVATQADLDTLREAVSKMDIPDASLTQKGKVQLSSKTDGTSETVAATEKAVRDARDIAVVDSTTKSNSAIVQMQSNLNVHSGKVVSGAEVHGIRINTGRFEYSDGGSWIKLIAASTVDITYYVNVNTGDDSNTGLQSNNAFRTINKALSIIPNIINHNINIRVSAGTYTETLSLLGFSGSGFLRIFGEGKSTSVINGRVAVGACPICRILIDGFTVNYNGSTSYTSAVSVYNCQYVQLNLAINNSTNTIYGVDVSRSFVDVFSSNISNKKVAIVATSFSHVWSDNNSGSANSIVFQASIGSVIIRSNGQPSGTTTESIDSGGTIR